MILPFWRLPFHIDRTQRNTKIRPIECQKHKNAVMMISSRNPNAAGIAGDFYHRCTFLADWAWSVFLLYQKSLGIKRSLWTPTLACYQCVHGVPSEPQPQVKKPKQQGLIVLCQEGPKVKMWSSRAKMVGQRVAQVFRNVTCVYSFWH